jgi:tetratricopeptide (TPR) repeat protein
MAVNKTNLRAIIAFVIVAAGITGIIAYKKIGTRNSLARQIAELSPRGGPPQGIDDLRKAIGLYQQKIEEHVQDAARTGNYWKILGSRLIDRGLYGEAMEALEEAVRYYPEDETIHYLLGYSARILARSEYFAERDAALHFKRAEQAFRRAIDIYGRYSKALFGISELYVFDLDRASEAVPCLELYLDINKSDTDAMFVLARAYYVTENYEGAVALYDKITGITKDPVKKAQAEANKQQVLAEWYG